MCEHSYDPKVDPQPCSTWHDILEQLEKFPIPITTFSEGEVIKVNWIFRGLADSDFHLEPSIEREAMNTNMPWLALEKFILDEFNSRSRLYFNTASLPDPQDLLSWLALMQHYTIPTRLLDFAYSPFIALYFAIREQKQKPQKRAHVRLWAINETEVNKQFLSVTAHAQKSEPAALKKVSITADTLATEADSVSIQTKCFRQTIDKSMSASGAYRHYLNDNGCIAVAQPTVFNPRLSNQQGVFLVNCSEDLKLGQSLTKMMTGVQSPWCRLFDINKDAIPEIEKRLFQMNIHEQSLFPDMEGLAGFIRQKIRLHWK